MINLFRKLKRKLDKLNSVLCIFCHSDFFFVARDQLFLSAFSRISTVSHFYRFYMSIYEQWTYISSLIFFLLKNKIHIAIHIHTYTYIYILVEKQTFFFRLSNQNFLYIAYLYINFSIWFQKLNQRLNVASSASGILYFMYNLLFRCVKFFIYFLK